METRVNRHIKLLKIWIVQEMKRFQMTKGEVQLRVALDSSFLFSKSQGDTVTGAWEVLEKNANKIVIHKEGRNNNPYEFLIFALEKQLKMESDAILLYKRKWIVNRGQLRNSFKL